MSLASLVTTAVLATTIVSGCSGTLTIVVNGGFIPEAPTPPAGSVTLQAGVNNANVVMVEVVTTGVTQPISGIDIMLAIPDQMASYVSCFDGQAFPAGSCTTTDLATGRVLVSHHLPASDPPVTLLGSRTVLRVQFLVEEIGQGTVIIENPNLGGGAGSALMDAGGNPIAVTWHAGSLFGE